MRRTPILALLTVLALLVSACGDDDASTATDDTVADATDEVSEETTEDSAGEDDGEVAAGETGECGFLAGFATAFEDFDPSAVYSGEEATDFGELFTPLAEAADDVAESAPEEIQEAFRTMAEGFGAVAEELDGVVLDLSDPEGMDPETMAKLESLETSFGADFEAASTEIEAWIGENCAEYAERFGLEGLGS